MPGRGVEREFSAGGVVVHDGRCIVIVPTRRAADGSKVLALPKGHPDKGETTEQAALREVREEAGVECTVRARLGDAQYWYQRDGRRISKVVTFFLLDYVAGDPGDHDHEVEQARWVTLEEAVATLTYPGDRAMAAKAISVLAGNE